MFEVFYIDYGNQEAVAYSQLRPVDPSVSAAPGLAQLCSLAYIKIPNLEEDFGQEAAEYLSELTLNSGKEFRAKVEEKDTSGGKVKQQGTGTILAVTLVAVDAEISVNAAMLQVILLLFILALSALKVLWFGSLHIHRGKIISIMFWSEISRKGLLGLKKETGGIEKNDN